MRKLDVALDVTEYTRVEYTHKLIYLHMTHEEYTHVLIYQHVTHIEYTHVLIYLHVTREQCTITYNTGVKPIQLHPICTAS